MQAAPLLRLVIRIYGTAATLCVAAGVAVILWDPLDPAGIPLLGLRVTSAHLGAALIGFGLLTAFFLFCLLLLNQRQLAFSPPADRSRSRP